jgi:hypothetical protein
MRGMEFLGSAYIRRNLGAAHALFCYDLSFSFVTSIPLGRHRAFKKE